MPEGDTIHHAARRIRPLVEGLVPEIEHPSPRLRGERWPQKLDGRYVQAVDAHGKHLFVRFDGGLTVHSHLRMTGAWGTYRDGQRWRRAARRAWLVLRTERGEVVQFDGPVLELLTESRARFDRRLAELGPDILAGELDEAHFLARLREDDPTRPIGEALLDQRTIAGIGNLWKCEGCFAAGIDPWRATGDVADDEALAIVRETRPRMRQSALDGRQDAHRVIYAQAGRPCPRCGEPICSRGQGEDNRITYWCSGCQR
jgi:endonuclease-8